MIAHQLESIIHPNHVNALQSQRSSSLISNSDEIKSTRIKNIRSNVTDIDPKHKQSKKVLAK